MARAVGISHDSVQRIWKANDLKPHLTRTFKLSRDPQFETKFWDVIGLYLNPPDKALVLCCDEKSQCQALERTQPGLPLGAGHIKTRTHDYYRHGTITLFAALNYLDGKIISRTEARHTHVEWLRFLKQLERDTPPELDLHLIVDNYATHKHTEVKGWLARRPRFHIHFTPTGSSWLNLRCATSSRNDISGAPKAKRFLRKFNEHASHKRRSVNYADFSDRALVLGAQVA
jgi:transposase